MVEPLPLLQKYKPTFFEDVITLSTNQLAKDEIFLPIFTVGPVNNITGWTASGTLSVDFIDLKKTCTTTKKDSIPLQTLDVFLEYVAWAVKDGVEIPMIDSTLSEDITVRVRPLQLNAGRGVISFKFVITKEMLKDAPPLVMPEGIAEIKNRFRLKVLGGCGNIRSARLDASFAWDGDVTDADCGQCGL